MNPEPGMGAQPRARERVQQEVHSVEDNFQLVAWRRKGVDPLQEFYEGPPGPRAGPGRIHTPNASAVQQTGGAGVPARAEAGRRRRAWESPIRGVIESV